MAGISRSGRTAALAATLSLAALGLAAPASSQTLLDPILSPNPVEPVPSLPQAPTPPPPPPPPPAEPCSPGGAHPSTVSSKAVRQATICLVNRFRASRRLRAVRHNSRLARASERHAADMVRGGFFGHRGRGGTTPGMRMIRAGYGRRGYGLWSVGETLAFGAGSQATPESIVDAWLRSPTHRRVLANGRYREIGIGIAVGSPVRGGSDAARTYAGSFGARRR